MNNSPIIQARSRSPQSISVVVPCYNEQEVLRETYTRVKKVCNEQQLPYEIIFVNDGSRDQTWQILLELTGTDPSIKAIKLSRNFGHQMALTCGLDQSSGEVVVIMDADLQDPPELLNAMLEKWREGFDIVYGKRTSRRGEPLLKRLFAYLFYRTIRRFTGVVIPEDTGDFRLMDRCAVLALLALKERHRFIRGMVSWIGFNQTPIMYERPERYAGQTKYPFRKSLLLAVDAITSFSYAPLRLASYLGVAVSGFAFVYIVIVIVLKLLGISFSGYTSIMASILLLGGVQLIVLGIIGEYVGRIFEQGQNRPLYLVDQILGEPLKNSK